MAIAMNCTKEEMKAMKRQSDARSEVPAALRYEAAVLFDQIIEERRLKVARLRREIEQGAYRVKSIDIAAALMERVDAVLDA